MSAQGTNVEPLPASEPRIHLVGGINFSTWADLKWSRASGHFAILKARFEEWHASAPLSVESVLREDARAVDLVARVPCGFPTHEWALNLGDALHNLRSALDAVAWGMAHFDDAIPANPTKVTFPICSTETQWNAALKVWAGAIHPELQARLKVLQPFNYTNGAGDALLSMLHSLDIQDKHRDILTVTADLNEIGLDGFFELEDPEAEMNIRLEMHSEAKFRDGVLLGTMHTGARVRLTGQLFLRPAVRAQLTHRESTYDAIELLEKFVVETRRYLDILMHGLATPDDADEAQWSPLEVGPPAT